MSQSQMFSIGNCKDYFLERNEYGSVLNYGGLSSNSEYIKFELSDVFREAQTKISFGLQSLMSFSERDFYYGMSAALSCSSFESLTVSGSSLN